VYICLCNALTDKQVKQAVAANGFRRLVDVYEACGCQAQCGQCAQAVLRLVRDQQEIKSAA
jgi:bacterioferritin-associated ferredoxin